MARRMIEGIEIETSFGNVFADLGLTDAEKLKIIDLLRSKTSSPSQ